ncbi:MAG TPA: hypothetical protein VF806_03380 [Anaerolineaceae bacterium]
MDAITLPDAHQIYIVIGGRNAASRLLDLAARLALRGPLLLLDCGNRANPQPLVRELRRLTPDPLPALNRIQAARAFTCYQAAALLEEAASRPVQYPVIIFDLLATFYDESVSYGEGRHLLEQCLRCMTRIRGSAPLLVSARPPLADFPERKTFLEMLCRISDQYWVEETPPAQPPQQLSLLS